MYKILLCAVALVFFAALTNGAGKDHKYPWESRHRGGGKHLVYDQVEGWNPETVAVAMQEKPQGIVHDERVRRQVPPMPPMPEMPSPPQGVPLPPMPAPPGMPS